MRKILLFTIITASLLLSNCTKQKEQDKSGTLRVVNQTNCSYNITGGSDSGNEYIGTVAPLETKDFTIHFIESFRLYFKATPVNNCPNSHVHNYDFFMNYGDTKNILIDN